MRVEDADGRLLLWLWRLNFFLSHGVVIVRILCVTVSVSDASRLGCGHAGNGVCSV